MKDQKAHISLLASLAAIRETASKVLRDLDQFPNQFPNLFKKQRPRAASESTERGTRRNSGESYDLLSDMGGYWPSTHRNDRAKTVPYNQLPEDDVIDELRSCFFNDDWWEDYMEYDGPKHGEIDILRQWTPFFKEEAKYVYERYVEKKAAWAVKNGHFPKWFVNRLIEAIEKESKVNRDSRLRFNLKSSFGWPWLALLGLPFVAFAQSPGVAAGVYIAAVLGICLLSAMISGIAHQVEKRVETKQISLFKERSTTFLLDQKAQLDDDEGSVVEAEYSNYSTY